MENFVIKSVIVDTLNAIQNLEYMRTLKKKGKAAFDDWTDYGVDIYLFIQELIGLGFEIVLVLGKEGAGKSYGIKGLTPGEYVWFNTDHKNPTFSRDVRHKQLYGNKNEPGPLMRLSESYNEIISACAAIKKGVSSPDFSLQLAKNPVAFLLGHTEEYKSSEGEIKTRLKVLGKLATKMQLEGLVEHCYMAEMRIENGKPRGYLRTQNSGNDTARSPEGMFSDLFIPSDFSLILNGIENY